MMREPATSAFPYIKLKTYKTVVTVDTLEKWKRRPKPHRLARLLTPLGKKKSPSDVYASGKAEPQTKFIRLFHSMHNPSTAEAKKNCSSK
jgi:hypothetical protein